MALIYFIISMSWHSNKKQNVSLCVFTAVCMYEFTPMIHGLVKSELVTLWKNIIFYLTAVFKGICNYYITLWKQQAELSVSSMNN